MNVIEEIRKIVEREQASSASDSLTYRIKRAFSELPGAESDENVRHRVFEYEIGMGHRNSVESEAKILKWLRPLNIAAAPELAATIEVDQHNSLSIRRYWSCPGERLIPAEETNEAFAPARWDQFRRDMAKLAEHGKVHPYARGVAHVLVSASSGTILLNAWSVLKDGTEHEKRDFLQSIDNIPLMRM